MLYVLWNLFFMFCHIKVKNLALWELERPEFSLFMYLKLFSVPRASRIRPLQYAQESSGFSLWNAPQLQPPTGLANNWGNHPKCNRIAPKNSTLHHMLQYLLTAQFGLISYHDLHVSLSSFCARPPPAAWGPSSVSNAKPSSMGQRLTSPCCSASLWR